MAEKCSCGECSCEEEIRVYFCPKCKSNQVRFVFEFGNIFGIIPKMKCFSCNYVAPGFPVLVTSKEKITKAKNKLKKKLKSKKVGGKK